MGCGSSSVKVRVPQESTPTSSITILPPTKVKRFQGVYVGLQLYCLDVFESKYTGETLRKWREAKVRVFDGYDKTSKVCIRFVGWSENCDKWFDLNKEDDLVRLAPMDLLSAEQIELGEDLDGYQIQVAYEFLECTKGDKTSNVTSMYASSPTALISRAETGIFKVGRRVDVKDVLFKGAESHVAKWRVAEIIDVSGSKLRVHFIGWDDSWDEVIDIAKESDRVRESGTMTVLQGRPSLLLKSHSDAGRRGQRRSFDGKVMYTAAKSSGVQLGANPFNAQWSDGVDDDSSSPIDLLQNRKAKPAVENRKQRYISEFVSPKPPIDRRHSTSGIETSSRKVSQEISFCDRMEAMGLHIVEIEADGNCMFRAVAHQFYLDPDRHLELRALCIQHMSKHRERFSVFCTTNFEHHLRRMAVDGTWAAELEIRALEEIFDRIFSIYSSDAKEDKPLPMNTNFDERQLLGMDVETVKLSYHGGSHYNSIFDVKHALPLSLRKSSKLELSRSALFYGEN
jgi:hypothetical protein